VINPGAGEKVRWGWDQAISLLRDKQSQLWQGGPLSQSTSLPVVLQSRQAPWP
jgi:hypothetical protein